MGRSRKPKSRSSRKERMSFKTHLTGSLRFRFCDILGISVHNDLLPRRKGPESQRGRERSVKGA